MWERNPNAGRFTKPEGYRDLGWQLHTGNSEDVRKCVEAGHKRREFDNSTFKFRCTDVVHICDECRIVWHIDSSD